MSASGHILEMRHVRFRWPGPNPFGLSVGQFDVATSESVLLLGESGSGKSTLLSLVCGTVLPNSGTVSVDGQDLSALSGRKRDQLRAEKIGMIFQQFNLLPFGSVLDNIQLPLKFAPQRRQRVGDPRSEAARLCKALGLPDEILSAKASTLSVGQQQRVAVARAVIGHPPLIVADEPTSALDAQSQMAFLDLLFEQAQAHGTSLLMVSHDPRFAERFDRTLELGSFAQSERRAA